MKAEWDSSPLPETLLKVPSTKKIRKSEYLGEGMYPIVSQEEGLINGYWNDGSDVLKIEKPIVIFGDHNQIIKFIDFDFVKGADGTKVLSVKPFLEPKFLYYFLLANPIEAKGYARHFRFVKELTVPIPPLEEQKRIVAILDEAFAGLDRARAHTEANLQNAKDLFASFVKETFRNANEESQVVSFNQIARIESVLVDPREQPYLDLPHLGAGNMVTGTDELVSVKTSREEKLKSGKFPFDSKMVLYSKIRPYLRKVSRPDFEGICSADVYPLVPIDGVLDRNYLFHLLLGPEFTEYAMKGSDRAGMPKVNRKHLFSYEFELPDISIQKACAEQIDRIMRELNIVETKYQSKLTDLDDLRQSLLQKAFAGELT